MCELDEKGLSDQDGSLSDGSKLEEEHHGDRSKSSRFYDWIAPFYDILMKAAAFVDGIKPSRGRKTFVKYMELEPAERVLEVGVGTGLNLPLVSRKIGVRGRLFGLDNSTPMLEQCQRKLQRKRVPAFLVGGSAERLPFKNGVFDTVYVFGSFNLLSDPEKSISELMRVAVPRGSIFVSDKSLVAYKKHGLQKKLMLFLEPSLADPPPLGLIPVPPDQVRLRWLWKNLMYVLAFQNPDVILLNAEPGVDKPAAKRAKAPAIES